MKKLIGIISAVVLIVLSGIVGFLIANSQEIKQVDGETSSILVFDQFNDQAVHSIPYGYHAFGEGEAKLASVPAETNRSVLISSAELRKSFPAQQHTFTTELKFMQQSVANTGVLYLLDGHKQVISIETEDGKIVYRGDKEDVTLVETYGEDAWYVIKVVAHPEQKEVDLYINGNLAHQGLPFMKSAKQVNGIESIAFQEAAHYIDDLYVIAGEIDIPLGFGSLGKLPTGGLGGEVVVVKSGQELGPYVASDEPYIIFIDGDITMPIDMLSVRSNKTIIGLGDDATIRNGGLRIRYADNVVIRNIHFTDAPDDSLEIRGSSHVWIDHNTFSNGYDGLLDVRDGSSFVTISWNKFENHGKTSLVGHSDDNITDRGKLKVTYHHNWFHETRERHPRVRFGEVHALNNFYDAVGLYGIRVATEASVMAEANVFYKSPSSIELFDDFTGQVEEVGNLYVESAEPQVAGKVFDPFSYYTYPIDQLDTLEESVKAGAGSGVLQFQH